MVTIKKKEEIALLREGGKRLARILEVVRKAIRPGVESVTLNELAENLTREGGDLPSFLQYRSRSSKQGFPSSLCVSINDEIVHGVSTKRGTFVRKGDLVSIDMGIIHKGLYTDAAMTVGVGKVDARAEELLRVTKEALSLGIAAARAGNYTGDIGFAVEEFVKPYGFGIVRELAGHGVGYAVHEEPYVPNFGTRGSGVKLLAGMVIAIEPMINEGSGAIVLDDDGFTYRTRDGKRSAHFEHTVLITDGDAEVLTHG
jgi:methionyl aminopeptidase